MRTRTIREGVGEVSPYACLFQITRDPRVHAGDQSEPGPSATSEPQQGEAVNTSRRCHGTQIIRGAVQPEELRDPGGGGHLIRLFVQPGGLLRPGAERDARCMSPRGKLDNATDPRGEDPSSEPLVSGVIVLGGDHELRTSTLGSRSCPRVRTVFLDCASCFPASPFCFPCFCSFFGGGGGEGGEGAN